MKLGLISQPTALKLHPPLCRITAHAAVPGYFPTTLWFFFVWSKLMVHDKWLGLVVSICLDMVSIETFGVDSSKNDISTVQKSRQFNKDISTSLDMVYALKSRFVLIFNTVSIEILDLDIFKILFRLSRPPGL